MAWKRQAAHVIAAGRRAYLRQLPWSDRRPPPHAYELLGGDAPFYRCYFCADGAQISVGALEPQFYGELVRRIGAPAQFHEDQYDQSNWPERSQYLATLFATKTRSEWCEILEGTDACFAPVLTLEESQRSPHLAVRHSYTQANGLLQAAPAPRFSRTPGKIAPSGSGEELLRRWIEE